MSATLDHFNRNIVQSVSMATLHQKIKVSVKFDTLYTKGHPRQVPVNGQLNNRHI